jgi:hypothetical protein
MDGGPEGRLETVPRTVVEHQPGDGEIYGGVAGPEVPEVEDSREPAVGPQEDVRRVKVPM